MKPTVLVSWNYGIHHPTFGIEVYDRNQRYIYSIPLIKLHAISGNNGCEIDLRGGRFKNYTSEKQKYCVYIKCKASLEITQANILLFLDWICNNITEYWSLDVEITHVNDIELIFSFSDDVQATIFRFLFQ